MTTERVDIQGTSATPAGTQPTTTIVEHRSGGGFGSVLIGLAVLIGVVFLAYFLVLRQDNENIETRAVTEAAAAVGEGAQKVGDAAEKAGDKLTSE